MGIGATSWRRREGEAGMATTSSPQLLPGVRVLDLTDDKGLLAGKLLADIGADVILVEPPGGNPARHLGPFYNGCSPLRGGTCRLISYCFFVFFGVQAIVFW